MKMTPAQLLMKIHSWDQIFFSLNEFGLFQSELRIKPCKLEICQSLLYKA